MMMTKDIKSWPSHNWCPRNKTQTLSPSSPRPLELNMRLPWILVVSSLCAKVYGEDIQQVLGSSLDVSGASYTCAKGMLTFAVILISTNLFFFFKKKIGVKPLITCTDPSLQEHSCSCTCTNGISFDQPVPLASQNNSGTNADGCEPEREQWLEREQQLIAEISQKQKELLDREQEFLKREEDLTDKLSKCTKTTYQGCYTGGTWTTGTKIGTPSLDECAQ